MNRNAICALLLLVLISTARAEVRHEIQIPDPPGYQTLKCDFHMHTVFSDGDVWPTVRVDEAWRQGLDAIAITDHIEYQPKRDDVRTGHNRPYQLAVELARQKNVLLLKAAEITRDTPPGHFNAIFLEDVRPLEVDDFVEVVKRANQQGGFVFWNHQGWQGSEKGRWRDVHTTLHENKWLHGMEVCNGGGYYPDAHRWCLEKNLTMLGNSDIHHPDLRERTTPGGHRTMTLVFAKERTLPSLKEALAAGRTAVWFKEQVIGRRELLQPLLDQCIRIAKPHLRSGNAVWLEIRNVSDFDITLQRTGNLGPRVMKLPARTTNLLKLNTKTPAEAIGLSYAATNFLIAPDTPLPATLKIPGP